MKSFLVLLEVVDLLLGARLLSHRVFIVLAVHTVFQLLDDGATLLP